MKHNFTAFSLEPKFCALVLIMPIKINIHYSFVWVAVVFDAMIFGFTCGFLRDLSLLSSDSLRLWFPFYIWVPIFSQFIPGDKTVHNNMI